MSTFARMAWTTLSCALALTSALGCMSSGGAGDSQAQAGDGGAAATGGNTGSTGSGAGTGGSTSAGSGSSASSGSGVPSGGPKRIVGYFASWDVYARNYHVPQIQADKLTHVNYAFANISADGQCMLGDSYADTDKAYPGDTWDPGVLRGSFHQLQLLKQAHPGLRTLISVGGWTWSAHFSGVAKTAASRSMFAKSCVDFAVKYGFDGIDIDWEYPVGGGLDTNENSPEDKQNYTLLLAELRAALDAQGKADGHTYELTIAAPAGPAIMAHVEMDKIHPLLDAINVMTYDFHGAWEKVTNFNAPLYASKGDPSAGDVATTFNDDAAIKGWLAAGVPASKLVMGVPFYGRGWAGVPAANDGLFQSSTGPSQGTWEAGVLDYKDIKDNYLSTYTRKWSDEAKAPWLYSAAQGVMITYDDPQSMKLKADYINGAGLGGAMVWEMSSDDAQGSLLNTLATALRP